MRDLVSVNFKFPNFLERYRAHFHRIYMAIASDVQTNRALLFDAEGAYNGHAKWKDLASGANNRRAKNGLRERNILRKSGALRLSLAPENPNGQAGPNGYVEFRGDFKNPVTVVGTRLKYARIQNEGGVIQHPGTKNGFGRGIRIKPHPITIPARNFTDWNRKDADNLKIVLKNTIEEILNGR